MSVEQIIKNYKNNVFKVRVLNKFCYFVKATLNYKLNIKLFLG